MTAAEIPMRKARFWRQAPTFAAIGVFGFLVDSAITYGLVRAFGLPPEFARIPAFAFATVCNFWLNRRLTFTQSRAPLREAFLRYCLVSGAGLAVNWSVFALALASAHALALPTPPESLPAFVALGTGVAMFVTFFGFKWFAFRA